MLGIRSRADPGLADCNPDRLTMSGRAGVEQEPDPDRLLFLLPTRRRVGSGACPCGSSEAHGAVLTGSQWEG